LQYPFLDSFASRGPLFACALKIGLRYGSGEPIGHPGLPKLSLAVQGKEQHMQLRPILLEAGFNHGDTKIYTDPLRAKSPENIWKMSSSVMDLFARRCA
jgi:hypothetical protein